VTVSLELVLVHDRLSESGSEFMLVSEPGGPLIGPDERRPLIEDLMPLVKGLAGNRRDPLHQLLVRLRRVVHGAPPEIRLN
jgi:hypothetical protein